MVVWPGISFEMFLMENMAAIAFGMLGAFYMFGGYAVLRAIAMDELIDTVIERVNFSDDTSEPVSSEHFKKRFLGVMAIVSFAGGAFLFFHSALATAFFASVLPCSCCTFWCLDRVISTGMKTLISRIQVARPQ